jgi:hypothetical protein
LKKRLNNYHFKPSYRLTQYISSHRNFKSYLIRFNLSNYYLCECEQSIESPLHLIYNCDKYLNNRLQLINEVSRIGQKWPIIPPLLVENKDLYIELNLVLKSFQQI